MGSEEGLRCAVFAKLIEPKLVGVGAPFTDDSSQESFIHLLDVLLTWNTD
jgi:hypothetical protein